MEAMRSVSLAHVANQNFCCRVVKSSVAAIRAARGRQLKNTSSLAEVMHRQFVQYAVTVSAHSSQVLKKQKKKKPGDYVTSEKCSLTDKIKISLKREK